MSKWQFFIVLVLLALGFVAPTSLAGLPPRSGGIHSPDQVAFELVGHLDTTCEAIVIQGQYAYVTLGRELAVLDMADPTHPTRLGYTLLPVTGGRLDVQGGYAYVVGEYGQLVVVDVSAPTSPVVAGSLAVPGAGIDVEGSYAYLVDRSGTGFQVVDVSDPANMAVIGSCATEGVDVQVMGGYAYVAGGYDGPGLQVVDVTDPYNPVAMGSAPASALGVYVLGNYAYVADYTLSTSSYLRVIDVSNPAAPCEVGSEELFTGPWSEAYDVYVAASDPPGYVYAYVAGSAYIGGGWSYGGVEVVDVTDPHDPDSVNNWVAPDVRKTVGVVLAGDNVWLPAEWAGLRVIDVADPANLSEVGVLRVLGGTDLVVAAAAVGNTGPLYAYVTAWGLGVVDVTDPVYPVVLGHYEAPPPNYGAERVDLAGPYVYISDIRGGLRVMDVSDPANPTVIGEYEEFIRDMDVDEAGVYAYLASDPNDLIVLDVADPAEINPVSTYDMPGEGQSVHISGTYAYLGGSLGLWVVDVSDPANPVERGNVEMDTVNDAYAWGHYVYAVNTDHTGYDPITYLSSVDVSDPDHPLVVGSCSFTGWAGRLHVADNDSLGRTYAYLAGYHVWAVDVSDPFSPTVAGVYTTSWDVMVEGVYAAGDNVYVNASGLYVLRPVALGLKVAPASVSFLARAGGNDPQPRYLDVASAGGVLTWTATLSPTVDWLTVSPLSGSTPARLTVTAHISGLGVGNYETQLVVAGAAGVGDGAQIVPVRLLLADWIYPVYLPFTRRSYE
ncbi:MAG: hypothetical protein JW900_10970 [Anaerolineae bacterium]|nr:hypothetical protein [Anaerolineae bacterium]